MRRRIVTYDDHGWQIYNQISTAGALLLAVGVMMVLWNCVNSLRYGRIAPNDPWGGNSLEWYTTSPPPAHNFDDLPPIRSERPLYDLRQAQAAAATTESST